MNKPTALCFVFALALWGAAGAASGADASTPIDLWSLPTTPGEWVGVVAFVVEEESGCTATATCVYPPPAEVSCSSPQPGTCTSSNQFCGSVTCNGVTYRCQGGCARDPRCVGFCGDPSAACDGFTNCCVC